MNSRFLPPAVALLLGLSVSQPAVAESIGEAVEKHVDENLEGEGDDVRKKDQKSSRAVNPPDPKDNAEGADEPGAEETKADEPKSADKPKRPTTKKSTAKRPPPRKRTKKATSAKPKPTSRKKTRPKKSNTNRRDSDTRHSSSNDDDPPRRSGAWVNGKKVNFLAPAPPPPRIIGDNFEIDIQGGFGLRGWVPAEYPSLSIETQNYPQWYAGFDGRFFRAIRIYKAYYQSVGLSSPVKTGAVIAKAATKAAPGLATQALGVVGLQVKFVMVPMFRYEARSFAATASPNQPIRIIPFSANADDDVTEFELSTDDVQAVSTFETAIFGMHYNDRLKGPDGEFLPPKILPFYFGLGLTQYRKPYQVTVGNSTLDELMFNARFRGMGLALGFDIGGGIDKLGINFASQAGLGQIHLMHDYKLNEALPDDWFIGYLQGDLKIDYTMKLLDTTPTLLLSPVLQAGVTSFYYVKKTGDSDVGAPLANWDFLYLGMARLILPL